ncbi:hypothetical protein ACOZ38_28695 [Sphaerisporangium viridialbum]|uniref:hypothetical protein n=1 Tax=Sphaerisporangium viridialbum TaxID=46189 RepID=UPI003C718EC4
MARIAFLLLALFAEMERIFTAERAAHARSVATAKGDTSAGPSHTPPKRSIMRACSPHRLTILSRPLHDPVTASAQCALWLTRQGDR